MGEKTSYRLEDMTWTDNPIWWSAKHGLKNFFGFKGRASRQEYLFWTIAFYIYLVLGVLVIVVIDIELVANLFALSYVALLIPNFAVAWRRAQDFTIPGLFVLVMPFSVALSVYPEVTDADPLPEALTLTIMAAAVVLGLLLWLVKGSEGNNDYGPPPERWSPGGPRQMAQDRDADPKTWSGVRVTSGNAAELTVPRSAFGGVKVEKAEIDELLDDRYFDMAGKELLSGKMDPGIWARALAEAGPDKDRVNQKYIQLRVAKLRASR